MMILDINKRNQIKYATQALMTERGLHDTPMSMICERAGVCENTLSQHFKDKHALITELYLDQEKEMADQLLPAALREGPYEECFLELWHNFYLFLTDAPERLAILDGYLMTLKPADEGGYPSEGYMLPLIWFLEDGIRFGHLKPMSAHMLGYLITTNVTAIARISLSGLEEVTSQHLDLAAQSCWDGLKASV